MEPPVYIRAVPDCNDDAHVYRALYLNDSFDSLSSSPSCSFPCPRLSPLPPLHLLSFTLPHPPSTTPPPVFRPVPYPPLSPPPPHHLQFFAHTPSFSSSASPPAVFRPLPISPSFSSSTLPFPQHSLQVVSLHEAVRSAPSPSPVTADRGILASRPR